MKIKTKNQRLEDEHDDDVGFALLHAIDYIYRTVRIKMLTNMNNGLDS